MEALVTAVTTIEKAMIVVLAAGTAAEVAETAKTAAGWQRKQR
jgi:hypothetical protein